MGGRDTRLLKEKDLLQESALSGALAGERKGSPGRSKNKTHLLQEAGPFGEGDVHKQSWIAHFNGSCCAIVGPCHNSHTHTTVLDQWNITCLIVLVPVHSQSQ